jgi:hypothetical protein
LRNPCGQGIAQAQSSRSGDCASPGIAFNRDTPAPGHLEIITLKIPETIVVDKPDKTITRTQDKTGQEHPVSIVKDKKPRKSKPGRKYCCVPLCSNHTGKVMDTGEVITLHRIPQADNRKSLRKEWIKRLKNVRQNLIINDNTRVCSAHFLEYNVTPMAFPSIFPSKPLLDKQISQRHTRPNYLSEEHAIEEMHGDNLQEQEEHLHEPAVKHVGVQVGHSFSASPVSDGSTSTKIPLITPEDLCNNDDKTRFYTGFISFAMFNLMYKTFVKHGAEKLSYWEGEKRSMGERSYHDDNINKPGKKRSLRTIDEFFMVCMWLRLGTLQEQLADMFFTSVPTVSRVITTWVNFMYDHMTSLIAWPTREQILINLPKSFRAHPNTRTVVDAT